MPEKLLPEYSERNICHRYPSPSLPSLPPPLSPSLPPLPPPLPPSLPPSLCPFLNSFPHLSLRFPHTPSFPQASLFHPLVGRLELFPRHTIILDRMSCSNVPTGLPPTVATVTNTEATPTPPSTASQTCHTLYEIVQRYTSEPFVCRLRENCDGFWCRLDILDTHYNISIQVVKRTVACCLYAVTEVFRLLVREPFKNWHSMAYGNDLCS